jgi:hypothetical protein
MVSFYGWNVGASSGSGDVGTSGDISSTELPVLPQSDIWTVPILKSKIRIARAVGITQVEEGAVDEGCEPGWWMSAHG